MILRRPSISRRALLQGAAALAATPAFAQSALAQSGWPDHNIRLIVPYPAGGSTDVLFRILAEKLKEKLGQSIVVENRPGASGNTGIDSVAKARRRLHHRRRHRRPLRHQPIPVRAHALRFRA